MTILDNNHPRKKPLDFGQYGITGSVDYRNGGLIALNSYHPEHGYVTLTSAAPFPDDQRYDQAAVRRYRESLATLPGFGYQVDQPIVEAKYQLLRGRKPSMDFKFATGQAEHSIYPIPFGAEQWIQVRGVTAQWRGKLCLMRCAYSQLTEGGIVPAPPVHMQITFEDGLLTIYSPTLQCAVAVTGFPKGEYWSLESDQPIQLPLPDITTNARLHYAFGETLKSAVRRAEISSESFHDAGFWASDRYSWQLKPEWSSDPMMRRGATYALSMAVFIGDNNCTILTDHMLLPLSWNRDAYYVARALLIADLRYFVRDHIIWLFEKAERINGFWGRCYLANGKIKDAAFQLDQQLYPLLELADYYQHTGDFSLFNRFREQIVSLVKDLFRRKHPNYFLLPTDETPGDDPIDLPYHFSSHLLLSYVVRFLRKIGLIEDATIEQEIDRAIQEAFIAEHDGERIYAYAIDGAGNHHFYHDANDLPLALAPLWGVLRADDPVWRATIRFAFSDANSAFFGGRLGSVHTPAPWPLGDLQEWLIAQIQGDSARINQVRMRLNEIMQWDGALPEAYNLEGGSVVSRHWFAWPNAVYLLTRLRGWIKSGYEMDLLKSIYNEEQARGLLSQCEARVSQANHLPKGFHDKYFSEKTVTLITYGDSIHTPNEAPLKTLHGFLNKHVKGVIDTVHILPFYPYSSDDGFSVIDYYAVNPELGDWADIEALKDDFRLMFDAVINHMSAESEWFRRFLAGDPEFAGLFFTESPETDLSMVTRPRTTPLLTPFTTPNGDTLHLWTTFSADQIDLDYRSPQTLLRVLDMLLFYIQKGATVIRLDAIAYMWKQAGTTSIHLPQTHAIIQFLRQMLPRDVILITETNVPHAENISYFGYGVGDEANLVYNFTLPPLLLHTMYQGNAAKLAAWINTLEVPSNETTFFNFTASHDGIGVRPVEGILTREELDALIAGVEARDGRVSYRNNPDGSRSPYELNITYVDAVSAPGQPDEVNVQRFLLSQAVLLALAGVPAIYIHSLLGSHNDLEGMAQTGRNRTINRAKLDLQTLEDELRQPESFRAQVFSGLQHLIKVRTAHSAFSPEAAQHAETLHDGRVLTLRRTSLGGESVLCVFNFSSNAQIIPEISGQYDLLTGSIVDESLPPYGVRWLRAP